MIPEFVRSFLLGALLLTSLTGQANAQLLAYEGFDYAPGEPLAGKTGGVGWSQEWRSGGDSGSYSSAGSLTFKNLAVSGNKQEFPRAWSGTNRLYATAMGESGTVAYFSFLLRCIDGNGVGPYRYRGCAFSPAFTGKGGSSDYICLETGGGTGIHLSNTICTPGVTYFFVVRATFRDGADRFELFINPPPGVPLPAQPDVVKEDIDAGIFNTAGAGGDAIFQYDEFRLGRTWEDVSPTSEQVLLQNQDDFRIAKLTLNGNTFTSSTVTSPTLPPDWRVAATADFDGDKQKDIVVQNNSTRAIAILYMDGSTVRLSKGVYPTLPPNWRLMASGDFNGDKKPDLVVQNEVTQQLSALTIVDGKMTGSVPFSQRLLPDWQVVGTGDFNADGETDTVVQNSATKRISVLTMSGVLITGSVSVLPNLPPEWEVGAVGDWNFDGKPDLLVQNLSDRRLALISVANFRVVASSSLSPSPPAGWKLSGPR